MENTSALGTSRLELPALKTGIQKLGLKIRSIAQKLKEGLDPESTSSAAIPPSDRPEDLDRKLAWERFYARDLSHLRTHDYMMLNRYM